MVDRHAIQNIFYKALLDQDIESVQNTLSRGAKIINENGKKNTMSIAINMMLGNFPENFNIDFICDLFNIGSRIHTNDSHTLIKIITCANEHKNIEIMKKKCHRFNEFITCWKSRTRWVYDQFDSTSVA